MISLQSGAQLMLLGLIGKTPVTIIFMILIICFHGIYKVYKPTEAEGAHIGGNIYKSKFCGYSLPSDTLTVCYV